MIITKKLCITLAAAVCIIQAGRAQTRVATGVQQFGSYTPTSFETIDNATLNAHFEVPIVAKAGRGMPFTFTLAYDSSIWTPTSSSGTSSWTPSATWGWSAINPATAAAATVGFLTYDWTFQPTISCGPPPGQSNSWAIASNFVYRDWLGTSHSFPGAIAYQTNPSNLYCHPGSLTSSETVTTTDGSGYVLAASIANVTQASISASLKSASGSNIVAPLTAGSSNGTLTDSNGNQISASGGTFTDTLGTTAVTVTGAGSQASPLVFTYNNPQASTSTYTVNFKTKTIQTNFGCSGVTEYSGSVDLVDNIALPDGTKYQFTYEATSGVSGAITGRLASVTLPAGGVITWLYYPSGGSGNKVSCADGSGLDLQRQSPDGTMQFTRSGSPLLTTTALDAAANQTVLNFQQVTSGDVIYSYETERQTYALTSTLLQTVNRGYNGSQAASPCTAGTLSLPISQVLVNTVWPNNLTSQVCSTTTRRMQGG